MYNFEVGGEPLTTMDLAQHTHRGGAPSASGHTHLG